MTGQTCALPILVHGSSSARNHVLNHHQAKLLGASNTFVPYAAAPDPGADVHCLPNFFMDDEVTIKYE